MELTTPGLAISKEVVQTLPTVTYTGDITVVDDAAKADAAVEEIRRAKIVGFDTETKPSFRKGCSHKVALMQIATHDKCFLFRLNKIGIIDSLRELLEDPTITKIGLSTHDDFAVIRRTCPLQPQGFIELQSYVKTFGINDLSLQKIYAIIFGKRISKNQRLTNWEADKLTEGQQNYASLDAWACLQIYDYLHAGEFDPSSSPYRVEPSPDTDK